ncbi:MAG: hypothetical protein LUE87_01980 [Lachnospiraceae bacterium]|nr:hypothetical protein [Lachnospiraceae bacterium]
MNTIQALQDLGYGRYVESVNAEDVVSLYLYQNFYEEEFENTEDILLSLGGHYGVDMTGESLELDSEEYAEFSKTLQEDGYVCLELTITDREEIEEILALCDYEASSQNSPRGLFSESWENPVYAETNGWVVHINSIETGDPEVSAYETEGEPEEILLSIRSGRLPKKYLLRMAETVKEN